MLRSSYIQKLLFAECLRELGGFRNLKFRERRNFGTPSRASLEIVNIKVMKGIKNKCGMFL